ncbi:MAG: isopeptide-forming domain-containing fimbrial protein [Spirulinaceae cyanobacterium]
MKLIKLGSGSFYIIALTAIISLVAGSSPAIAQPPPIENTASASGDNLPTGGVDSNLNRIVISNTITTPVNVAEPAQLELIKTADRAAAEPGDTVVYRLSLKNSGTTAVTGFTITDTMPLGLNFLSESLQGSITDGTSTTPTTLPTATSSGRTVTFTSSDTLNPGQILNVIYAAVVTPDAVRGDGRNTAQEPRSNLASYRLRIRPGILSDCGTVVGRVFVDKNFDGEQQPGESGVPNAVVIMDDGNRITADANGLFSMANVISGNRTGTLDLNSLPGYTLAPNLYFIERNSQSRLVRLEPGGLVRMNFAVTPASGEEQ